MYLHVSNPSLQFTVKLVSQSTLTFKADGNLTPKDNLGRKSDGKLGFTGISGSVTKVVKSANDNYTNAEKAVKNLQNIFGGSSTQKNKPWELLNFVPGLGYALGFVDALVGVFDKSKPNATKPTAYKMDFEANGTFSTVSSQKVIRWNVPGSSITVVPPTTIQYNNALGVFTLLEKPTIIFTNIDSYEDCGYPESGYSCTTYKNRMVLDQYLKYAMNPAISSSFSEFKMQVRIEIDLPYGAMYASPFVDYDCLKPALKYEYLSGYQESGIGGLSNRVFLKVAVKYKVGNNEGVYMARYPANLRSSDNNYGCYPASLANNSSIMTELCGSTDYRNRSNQYLRTGNSSEKIAVDQNGIEEDLSDFIIYPNPSSGILNLEYNVKEDNNVHIYVTDLAGKKVSDIVSPQFQNSGRHHVRFDLTAGRNFSPGMYICRFSTGTEEITQKVIVR